MRYSIFLHYPMNFEICDVMISISARERIHFCLYHLNHNKSFSNTSIISCCYPQQGMHHNVKSRAKRIHTIAIMLENYFICVHIVNYQVCQVPYYQVSIFGVFLVRIFPHSDGIRRDTEYLSVFSPNAGKCGPEKLQIRHFSRSE